MDFLFYMLFLGTVISMTAGQTPDVLRCTFNSDETDCFLEMELNTMPNVVYGKSEASPYNNTGPSKPLEGDRFLYVSQQGNGANGYVYLKVNSSYSWEVTDYCLEVNVYQWGAIASTSGVDVYGPGQSVSFPGVSINEWINTAIDTYAPSSTYFPINIRFYLAPTDSIYYGIDDVKLHKRKCGCIKKPCPNDLTCYEGSGSSYSCKME